MVETMRMVIKTTSEVEKASSDLSEQLTRATTHHRRFISEVDLLRRSILDDLQNSRTEATGMFQQLFAQTETGIQSILARIFATMEQAEQATESFDQKIEASSKNALELNGLIVHSKRIVLDGASEVSAAHRRQIEDSQALALQHLESMGESFALKLLALENATTKMVSNSFPIIRGRPII